MRSILRFLYEDRMIYLNCDSIATVEQHKCHEDKSLIILINGTSYEIDMPVEQVCLKIFKIADESMFLNKSVLKVL